VSGWDRIRWDEVAIEATGWLIVAFVIVVACWALAG